MGRDKTDALTRKDVCIIWGGVRGSSRNLGKQNGCVVLEYVLYVSPRRRREVAVFHSDVVLLLIPASTCVSRLPAGTESCVLHVNLYKQYYGLTVIMLPHIIAYGLWL